MFIKKIKIFNPFAKFSGPQTIGIDFSNNLLRIACLNTRTPKKEVTRLFLHETAGLSDSEIVKLISSSLSTQKSKIRHVTSIISSDSIITKNIEIPSVDPKEIKEIINLQASRHTPYSREEVAVGYIHIGTYRQNYSKILLIIVARNIMERHSAILEKAGLNLERIVLAPESLARQSGRIFKLADDNLPVVLLHVDQANSDFIITFRNKAVFIRSIPIGAQQLGGPEDRYQGRFTEEVKKSLEAYQNEDIEKMPYTVVLTGAIQNLEQLDVPLNNSLQLPIKIIPYFNQLDLTSEAQRVVLESKDVSFFGLITCLINGKDSEVDLVPERIRLKKSLEKRTGELIRTGITVLVLLIFLISIFASKIYFQGSYLNKLNTQHEALSKEVSELEKDFDKISLIKDFLSNAGYSVEIIAQIHENIPMELELNYIKFDEQNRLSLRGTAESRSVIYAFVERLEKAKYFQNVKTKYATTRREGLKDFSDFEISAELAR
jgi:Tfp pilus assembly PilM family ATPase/Tfp pilus assembly protein PilN